MRLTLRNTGVTAARRVTRTAVAAVLLTGLLAGPLNAYPSSAGSATSTAATSAAAAAAAAAADDLTGDIAFSVPSRTFQGQISVSLSTAISGAQIRYTTDGKPPTAQSALYGGQPLQFTRTTQLRAQAFVGGTASGKPGTAMYVATSVTTAHDLPLVLIDSYGKGKPGRDYLDAATMIFAPGSGATTSLNAAPAVATRAGFHLRGQSSASFEKAPYRLEFWDNDNDDADYPVLGMPADSDWVLRGPFPDKSLIREALVYDLGKEMGLQVPRYRFVELYLNTDSNPVGADDYMGVYMLEETIKDSKNRLDLKQLDEDDTTLPKITGGYIWKFEWMAAEEPTLPCSGSSSTCWSYLEVVDPSPLQPQQKDWLRGYIQEFHNVLHSQNFADPDTGYQAYIDVGSFIDQMIIYELSRNMDAYYRSAYFYKDRNTKIFAGPLWDYDLTFGVGGFFQNDQTSGWQYQQPRQPIAFDWFTQLLRDPAFVDQVKARWQELRRGVLSDAALQSRIDALAQPLTNAAQRNFQRWPNLTTRTIGFFITPTASTWQGQVQYLRDWTLRRAAWLDSTAAWGGPVASPSPSPSPSVSPSASPSPSPSVSPSASPSPSPSVSPSPSPSPSPSGGASGACSATVRVVSSWPGGFQGEVTVSAGNAAINGWTVKWTWPGGQTITQLWGGLNSGSGSAVTVRNESWNGSLAANTTTTFGFLGNGSAVAPTATCTSP
ncbi:MULTISPECIES: CotH kinase family protein [unclassified Microbispora]|uniref:CotH kinase family protein n=1 Tax=unclassified Microbispora TaxID=2614687 RepID=UPI00197B7DC9|nr:CotH kinase family protein [Microbispora sp. SCL1-1]